MLLCPAAITKPHSDWGVEKINQLLLAVHSWQQQKGLINEQMSTRRGGGGGEGRADEQHLSEQLLYAIKTWMNDSLNGRPTWVDNWMSGWMHETETEWMNGRMNVCFTTVSVCNLAAIFPLFFLATHNCCTCHLSTLCGWVCVCVSLHFCW